MSESTTARVTMESLKLQLVEGEIGQDRYPLQNATTATASPPTALERQPGEVGKHLRAHRKIANASVGCAMENPLIMAKIAKTLPAKDMLAIRRTCTVWNHCFLPFLKKKQLPLRVCKLPPAGIDNILKQMELTQKFPFNGFQFGGGNRKCCSMPYQFDNLLEMGTKFGVTSLDFQHASEVDIPAGEMRKLIFELGGNLKELRIEPCFSWIPMEQLSLPLDNGLPQLKRVTFSGCDQYCWVNPVFLQLAIVVLKSAPKLEHLSIEPSKPHYRMTYSDSLRSLVSSLGDPTLNFGNLKVLQLSCLGIQQLQVLVELGRRNDNSQLRLEVFLPAIVCCLEEDPDPHHPGETVELFNTFLTTQAQTLRELGIKFRTDFFCRCETAIRIPRMEQVHTFELPRERYENVPVIFVQSDEQDHGEQDCGDFLFLSPIRMMTTFPNLRRFLYASSYRICFHVDVRQLGHSMVTQMEVEAAAENLPCFPTIFPAITELKITLTDVKSMRTFSSIWNMWPALMTLRLNICLFGLQVEKQKLCLDELLSGIPRRKLDNESFPSHKWLLELLPRPVTIDTLRPLLAKYKECSGLNDLQQLQVFELTTDHTPSLTLSEVGYYFGLAMGGPHLRDVTIRRENDSINKNENWEEYYDLIRSGLGSVAHIDLGN